MDEKELLRIQGLADKAGYRHGLRRALELIEGQKKTMEMFERGGNSLVFDFIDPDELRTRIKAELEAGNE